MKFQKVTVLLELKEGQEQYNPVTSSGYPELRDFFVGYNVKRITIESGDSERDLAPRSEE